MGKTNYTRTGLGNDDLHVQESEDGLITIATISRPEKQNAITPRVAAGLFDAIERVNESSSRVLVIRGEGGTFCSGGDLNAMGDTPDITTFRQQFSTGSELAAQLVALDALTVAAVEGYCLAGGMGIATACDLIVASDDATFGTPEINVGLFPMQAMASIMRTIPEKKGLELLFTGEFIDAEEASNLGLVSSIMPANDFEEKLTMFVDTLANKSPLAITMGKRAYYTQRDMSSSQALEYLRECFTILASSDQASEGLAAFEEDREPSWSR